MQNTTLKRLESNITYLNQLEQNLIYLKELDTENIERKVFKTRWKAFNYINDCFLDDIYSLPDMERLKSELIQCNIAIVNKNEVIEIETFN